MKELLTRIGLILSGSLLILNTFFASRFSNMNLGIIMPLIIGTPLLLVGVFYTPLHSWWTTNTIGALLKWCMIATYALFGILFAVTTTMILISGNSNADKPRVDAVIVLGAGIRGTSPSVVLRNRLDKTVEYYKK